MRNIKRFIIDFVGYFILLIGSVLIAVAEIVTQAVYALQKFWHGIIKPAFVDMLADAYLLFLVMLQAWYEMSAIMCLLLSKWLNSYAKCALQKSECLIEKTWSK